MSTMDDDRKRFLGRLDRHKQRKAQLPGEDEPPLPDPVEPIQSGSRPGRNDPCPCGSGKKYKKCCGQQDAASS
jgi:uncharacterized protein YecA (UPF0149 family)